MDRNIDHEEIIAQTQYLLETMHNLCSEMPEIILTRYFDSNKFLYALYHEAFNSIKGFCVLLGNGALVAQASMVLRMAMEQAATIRVLETHKELLDGYIEHQIFRFEILGEDNKKELIKNHFGNRIGSGENPNTFLEYGWLKPLDERYGLDCLIRLSNIQEQDDRIIGWKNQLNLWVHGCIQFINLFGNIVGSTIYINDLLMIAANLLDNIVCDFHQENGYEFTKNGVDLRGPFREAFKQVLSHQP